jgi:carbamoyltransferase
MPLNIVGISAHYHDAACCLLQGGRLVAVAEEERFSGIKHDPSLPRAAFSYCLKQAGLTIDEIDCIAYYEDPTKKLSRQLCMGMPGIRSGQQDALFKLDATRPAREIRRKLGYEGPIEFFDHHASHAASSFFFSGFEEAAVLTVDGVGEWATTTYGWGRGKELEIFEEVQFPNSIGLLYSAVTNFLGFDVNDAEYKVMGLAPYGQPQYVEQIRALIQMAPAGQYRLDLKYFDFARRDRMFSDALPALLGHAARSAESAIDDFHTDVARSLQVVLEETLLEKARYLRDRVQSDNLCLAGGVALNCVANGRLRRDGPFKDIFVQPAASDAGAALGAAALAHVRRAGSRPSVARIDQVYLGPAYSDAEIHQVLAATGARCEDFRESRAGLVEATARRLAAGKVVGWFQGRMEFGPRALGGRSILADPRGPEMRDKINAQVKKREGFRPFAPAVLEDRASQHFEIAGASPFMLETFRVRSSLDLPAVTHVDGSARVQTVARATSPLFHDLIVEFDNLSGCPILLNTSFNIRGEPIVRTPFDALSTFIRSEIDTLVLGSFILDRAAIPPLWRDFAERLEQAGRFFDGRMKARYAPAGVYTFL